MITEKGFVVPTLEEIYQRKLAEFKTVKPNIRETDSNVIIPLLKFDAAEEYDAYLEGLSVYNNLNVYTAVGSGLNAITSHLNMSWMEATRAKSRIQITASTETTIPQAWGVETVDGKKFVTLNAEDLKIQKGKTELDVISLNVGKENNVNVGQITKMTSIISGISSVTNTLPAVGGKDKETDTELRERYLKRIDRKSSFTTEGIKNYILENTNVQKCQVIENDTDLTDSDGRPLTHMKQSVWGIRMKIFYNLCMITSLQEYELLAMSQRNLMILRSDFQERLKNKSMSILRFRQFEIYGFKSM